MKISGGTFRNALYKVLSSLTIGAMLLGLLPLQPPGSEARMALTAPSAGERMPWNVDAPSPQSNSPLPGSAITGTIKSSPLPISADRSLDVTLRRTEGIDLRAGVQFQSAELNMLPRIDDTSLNGHDLRAALAPQGAVPTTPARASVLRDEAVDVDALYPSAKATTNAAAQAEGWPQVTISPLQPLDAAIRTVPNEPVPRWRSEASVDYTPASRPSIQAAAAVQATEPLLAVGPEYLNFAGQQGGPNPGSQTLHLGNKGAGTLSYALAEDIPWLSLSSTSGSVEAGESDEVVVSINTGGLSAAGSPHSGIIAVDNVSNPSDGEWVHVQLFIDLTGGLSTLYSYSSAGNLQRQVKPDGSVIDYEYDSLNRLTRISYPDDTSAAYTYDANGNRTVMTDTWGTTYYAYDEFNRLTAVFFPGLNPVQYEYDEADNLTRIVYPNGQAVNYGYDADNRLVSVTDSSGTTTYGYDPDSGLLTTKTLPNGIYTTYDYDADGRLTDVVNRQAGDSLISSYHYTLDANGNRTSVVEQTPGETLTTTYGYDELYRLAEVTYPDGRNVTYEYDALGNRLAMTDTVDGVTHYTYDAGNRLLQAGDEVFLHDANGNVVRRSSPRRTIRYAYDYENRLVSYDDGETVVEFVYDGDGNRVAKIVDGERGNYVNDVNGALTQVLLEADAGWYVDKGYTLGLDRINQADWAGNPLFYLYDSPLRSVTALADAAGALTANYDYDAFGMPLGAVASGDSPFLYNGEHYDPETGLIYLRNRYYDPSLARYTSRDPLSGFLKSSQSQNPYVFVGNNPVNYVDPPGLEWFPVYYYPDNSWWNNLALRTGLSNPVGERVKTRVKVVGWSLSFGGKADFSDKESGVGFSAPFNLGGIKGGSTWNGEPFVEISGPLGLGGVRYDEQGLSWTGFKSTTKNGITYEKQPIDFPLGPITIKLEIESERTPTLGGETFEEILRRQFYDSGGPPGGDGGFWGRDGLGDSGFDINGFFNSSGDFGGVSLDLTADLLLNIEDIAGATYDPKTGQIVFFGQEDVTLPPMEMDDLAVAIHSVYGGQDPGVSIGTEPSENPDEMKVRYDGKTVETYFGWVMFESDRVLKILSLGKDNITGQPVTSSVPGYKSMLQRELESGECTPGESSNRMWFRPKEVRLVRSADGVSMVFDAVSMEVLTESKFEGGVVGDPESEAFAAHFTEHYDDFAQEYPILRELKRLGKIVAVVKWIRDNNIPMDVSFLDNYLVAFYGTPAHTPETTVEGSSGTCHITMTGGVTYRPPNEYMADDPGDPLTGGMSDAALEKRPSEVEFMWSFSPPPEAQAMGIAANGEDLTAVAQSLARSRKDGNFTLPQTDMAFPIEGNLSLDLTRYYNSFYDEPSGFGNGWAGTPYQISFPDYEQTFTFGSTISKELHAQITVVERPAGREDVYSLLGLDGDDRAIYARPGSAELLRDNDDGTFTLTKQDETRIRFDATGQLVSITDGNGNQVIYTYSSGRLVRISQPGGRQIDLSYDGQGHVTQVAGPGGRTIAYTYDAAGNLVTATNVAAGQTITYTYDAEGYLIRAVDNQGNVIFDQTFDVYGRATEQTFGGTAGFDRAYDLNSQQTIITDPNGNHTRRSFDSRYRLLSSTDPLSNTLAVSYAGDLGPGVITDTQGARTQYFYDVRGNVAAILDDQGNLTSLYYNASDNLIAAQDARGVATAFGYDANSNLTTVCHEVSLVFDGNGDLVNYYYDPNNVTTLTYDGSGNLVSTIDAEGNTRQFDYDANGAVTAVAEASGLSTDLQYDSLSRLTQVSNGAGQSVSLGYDDADNVTAIATDAGTVHYAYDGNNNLASVTDANGNPPTEFDYDARDNLIKVTDADGETTDYAYDDMGNLVSADLPNDTSLSYDYDELNRLARVVNGVGASAADVALLPNALDFGRVQYGDSSTMTLTVFNQGTAALTVNNISSDNPAFGVDFTAAVVIPLGESTDFAVTFTPPGRGAYSGLLTVQSDDPDEGTLTVNLDGEGKNIVTGLTAVSGDNGIVLSWHPFVDAGNDFNHFNIYREETPITTTVAGLTPIDQSIDDSQVVTFTDRTVVSDTAYYYAVTAVYDDSYKDPEVEPAGPVAFMTGVDLVGPVIAISDLGRSEYKPRVAHNTTANEYLVVWEYDANGDGSNYDIRAARVQADGTVIIPTLVVAGWSYHDRRPDVAYNSAADEYLVVWEYDYYGNDSDYDIVGQRVSASGTLLGGTFFVGGYVRDECKPRLAYNSTANDYLVVWEYDYYDGNVSSYMIWGQLVQADGSLSGDDFFVGGFLLYDELKPQLAYNSAGNEYLVVFEFDPNGNGSNYIILGQRVQADGTLSGDYIVVSSLIYDELKPQLAYNSAEDEYLVVFEFDYNGNDTDYDCIGRRITASGAPAGGAFFVGGWINRHELRPQIAYNGAANGYLVIWEYDFYGDGSDWDVVGQRLAASGQKQGKAYFIGGFIDRDELKPHLAYNPAAKEYLAVWEYDYFGNGSDWDILGRRVGGSVPLLHVEPAGLDLGAVESSMPLTITNPGTGVLHWALETGQPWLGVAPSSGSTSVEDDVVTVTVTRTGLLPGVYGGTVAVVSTDVNQDVPVTLTVVNRPPNLPSHPTPQDGATELTSSDPDLAIPLKWKGGDPNGQVVTYTVYLGTDLSPPQVATGITDTTYKPDSLQGHTTYYWQIVASDGLSVTSGSVWQFSTANRSPFVPTDPGPVDGASGQPLATTLAWSGGDPDGDVVTYTIYFGTDFNPPLAATGATAAAYDPPGDLQIGAMYHWQIAATDGSITSTGPVWSFRTIAPDLSTSSKEVSKEAASAGAILTYTLVLVNNGQLDAVDARLTDTLPLDHAAWLDDLTCTGGGHVAYADGVVTWSGTLAVGQSVRIAYRLQLKNSVPEGTSVSNVADLDDGMGQVLNLGATTTIDNSAPAVTVVSPNGDESWVTNKTYFVTWSASDANLSTGPVTILYSLDGGSSWEIVASGVANTGSYPWTTPGSETGQALVKVEAVDKAGHVGWDQSDSLFGIALPEPDERLIYLPAVLKNSP